MMPLFFFFFSEAIKSKLVEETGYESRRTSKTKLCFAFCACHVILMVHTKSVSSHILQIKFFYRFIYFFC